MSKTQELKVKNVFPQSNQNKVGKGSKLIGKIQQNEGKQKQMNHSESFNRMNSSNLEQIRAEKSTIIHEIQRLSAAIDTVMTEGRSKSILKKRQQITNDIQARQKAISFINHQKAKKKELENRKKVHQSKIIAQLKKQVEQQSKKRDMYQTTLRQEKRRAISIKINQNKAKRDELKSIEKQSNFLINKLIRQEEDARKKIQSPNKAQEVNVKIIERRPHINFIDLQKHEQEYLLHKQELAQKKERSISISYPIKRFEKNKWAEKLDEQENKLKEEERLKSLEKRMRIEKRAKYGELISSLFLKKNKVKTEPTQESSPAKNSKSIYVMPSDKIPKLTAAKTQKFQSSQKKQLKKYIKSQYNSTNRKKTDLSPEDIERQHQRERKIRKQTSQRLKKMQSSIIQKTISEPQAKYQSQYQNYLGQVRQKKKEDGYVWNTILNNSEMTKEEKYAELIKNAATLENKAKFKQSLKEDKDEAVNLYINSIQVKLAILQSI